MPKGFGGRKPLAGTPLREGSRHPERDRRHPWDTRRVARVGVLTALGTALFVLESLIPFPLPFLKIGLSNIATLIGLILGGPADAFTVVVLRVVAGSFITGSFLSPSFLLSFSAGITSTTVMCGLALVGAFRPTEAGVHSAPRGAWRSGSFLGPVGVSLAGASTHAVTQLAVVAFVYARNVALFHLLPILLVTALVGGIIVGFIVMRILPGVIRAGSPGAIEASPSGMRLRTGDWIMVAALVAAISGLSVLPNATEGSTVTIQSHGQTVGRLDLREDGELTVTGDRGNLTVMVRNGAVRVSHADCPNRLCVRTGWRANSGEIIVCVPNHMIISVGGGRIPAVKATTG
jgi:heptaprenyl diphosphate synthase